MTFESLQELASLVEGGDAVTAAHCRRVSRLARRLAEAWGLDRDDQERIAWGGLLHDLGKVDIPGAVLNKPGKLTPSEQVVMRRHPELGGRLLDGHPLGDWVRACVVSHHETPDGKGYPRGLVGDQIPVDARIVGLADAFDAMTSTRPYRQARPVAEALAVIEAGLGQQFDHALGRCFLALGRSGALDDLGPERAGAANGMRRVLSAA